MEGRLRELVRDNEINAALTELQRIVQACILDRRSIGRVTASRMLDEVCQTIGERIFQVTGGTAGSTIKDNADCVILATELYRSGGHTAVIDDLLQTGRLGGRTFILLTDALSTADVQLAVARFADRATVLVAEGTTLEAKLQATLSQLQALRPRKLLLMNHPQDAVAVAVALPQLATETVFYHHADQVLCLGSTLRHSMHVDPHPMGFHCCGKTPDVPAPVYWPLVATDFGTEGPRTFTSDKKIRTCSAGSFNKFSSAYKYSYFDVILSMLKDSGGSHVHIGPIPLPHWVALQTRMEGLGISVDRFVHIPWTQSVWQSLQAREVDLYIDSFPYGGGRTVIESMGAGVPVVAHDSYLSPYFGDHELLYPGAFVWSSPTALVEHVCRLQFTELARESKMARSHFEKSHTVDRLSAAIDAGVNAAAPSALLSHCSDPMQSFLDDVNFGVKDHLTAPLIEWFENRRISDQARLEMTERAFEMELREREKLIGSA